VIPKTIPDSLSEESLLLPSIAAVKPLEPTPPTGSHMHIKADLISANVGTEIDVFMKEDAPDEQDIWDMTSSELVCLAATKPGAVVKHIQDLGKELNMRVLAPTREGE